jgi:hypothetical protein
METFKYKILLENYISREPNSGYGKFTADTLNINVMLTQDIKDVGRFLDYPFIPYDENYPTPSYQPIPQKLNDYGGGNFNFINVPGANFYPTGKVYDDVRYKYRTDVDYYTNNIIVTGLTEDRLENFTSYGYTGSSKYIPGFDVESGFYYNYLNGPVDGITRIISLNDFNPIIYTEDADLNDPNLGTILQGDGILFKTYSGLTRPVSSTLYGPTLIDVTKMYFHGQGVNQTNSSLSALTIEEYLLHITEQPKVESELFIDRGATDVLQSHLQMGEITSLGELVTYGNGFYNILR